MKCGLIGCGCWGLGVIGLALAEPEDPPVARPVLPENRPPVAEQVQPVPEQLVITSSTKQFRIAGSNELGRGLCAILAENAKEELLRLLEQPDDWKIPIAVKLHGEPGDKAPPTTIVTRLQIVEGVYHLHLDMHLAEGLRVERYKQAITEMLLYERALRKLPLVEEAMSLRVPPWLAVGLREASAWRMQQSDRHLYASMFKRGGAYKVDDLLALQRGDYEQLDEASEVAFRVSAGSLVMALLEQPGGRKGFREFIDEAAAFEGEIALLLRRHFPELNLSPNSLSKWWALQLANQGGLNLLTDVMSIEETEEQLNSALFLELPSKSGTEPAGPRRVGLEEWPRMDDLEDPQRRAAVKPAQASLVHLSYRCFPSYRPLLVEYQKQLIRLAQGEGDAVVPALQQLERARQIMASKAERGSDYLDWFEITRARETSGAFDDYLKLKQQLKQRDHDRKDAVSGYLDRMDGLFEREK